MTFLNLAIVTLNVITQMSCQKTGDLEQKQVYGSLSSLQLRKQDSGGLFTSSSFFLTMLKIHVYLACCPGISAEITLHEIKQHLKGVHRHLWHDGPYWWAVIYLHRFTRGFVGTLYCYNQLCLISAAIFADLCYWKDNNFQNIIW